MKTSILSAMVLADKLVNGELINTHIISIRDTHPSDELQMYYNIIDRYHDRCADMRVVKMDDIVGYKGSLFTNPSKEVIMDILAYVENANTKHLVVHCTEGVSRSSAVAFVCRCYMNYDKEYDPSEILNVYHHRPNADIINIGKGIIGDALVEAYESFSDRMKKKDEV